MIFVSWPLLVFIFQLPLIDIKDSNSGGGILKKQMGRRAHKGFRLPKVVGLQLFGQTCDPNPFDGPAQTTNYNPQVGKQVFPSCIFLIKVKKEGGWVYRPAGDFRLSLFLIIWISYLQLSTYFYLNNFNFIILILLKLLLMKIKVLNVHK